VTVRAALALALAVVLAWELDGDVQFARLSSSGTWSPVGTVPSAFQPRVVARFTPDFPQLWVSWLEGIPLERFVHMASLECP
jgi:hypothetical protein